VTVQVDQTAETVTV